MAMLEQVLNYLHNWFVTSIESGTFTIQDGMITSLSLADGQYFRIVGSVFNDGLYQYGEEMELTDETFDGAVWLLAVPKMVIDTTKQIEEWMTKYGDAIAGPYSSESFGGYSYSKGSGSDEASWQSKFASALAPYKKLAEMANVSGYGSHQDPSYRRPFNPEFPWG